MFRSLSDSFFYVPFLMMDCLSNCRSLLYCCMSMEISSLNASLINISLMLVPCWTHVHFGATDTPVSNFWWRLLWGSKPEWAALFVLGRGICVTCSLRFTSGVTSADLLAACMAAKPSLPHTCKALVELKTGSYLATTHSVRSGRRSTDWAIPAWLFP